MAFVVTTCRLNLTRCDCLPSKAPPLASESPSPRADILQTLGQDLQWNQIALSEEREVFNEVALEGSETSNRIESVEEFSFWGKGKSSKRNFLYFHHR